jgi:carboxyl-terminal processing protease
MLAACSGKSSTNNSGEGSRPGSTNVAQVPASSGGTTTVTVPPPDPREDALSEIVLRLLEKEHLLRKKIDDEVSRTAFKTYLDRLDGGKMFLLKEDRDQLAKQIDKLDDQLRSGRLDLAHEGAKIYAARVAMVEKMVESIMSKPLDMTNEESVEIDPEKLELAANEQELRERWRRRLELEVMERVSGMEARIELEKTKDTATKPDPKRRPLPNVGSGSAVMPDKDDDEIDKSTPLAQIPKTPEEREAKARADIAKTYSGRFARLKNPGPLDAAADVVNALSSALDPHTTYLPPADKANFDIQMSGTLEGIGAVLREKDHLIEIVELVPGGASWRQGGLAPGDLILSVAEKGKEPVDVFDMRIDEVVKMIRGPKNTVVRLRIQKPGGTESTLEITRDVVVLEEAYAKGAILNRKGAGPAYGYIHLPSFYGGKGNPHTAAGDVKRLLGEMRKAKVAGVVIDIRSNGGGYLNDAVDMTGSLIDEGPVVQIQDSRGQKEVLADDDRGTDYDGPVVVLVDRFSASASEIVAGALQDYGRAVIVGQGASTHGKGTVQTVADLDRATGGKIELGVFKITIQQFFRVSGSSTQREGVRPDVVLPDPAGHIESGEKELPNAIAWSQIKGAPHTKLKPTWSPTALAQKSAARVAKHPLLAKIATTTEVLKARRNDTKVPLQRAAWEQRKKALKAALEAASPDLKKAPSNFTVKTLGEVAPTTPGPGGKTDDRAARWSENIAKDPWIDETVSILADMTAK